jgi:type IV pilus assembly protein PilV
MIRSDTTPHGRKGQTGIGLIEVLIALLVISIGLLGVMGLQVNAKRTNYEALERTVALQLVEDMLVRMRTNAYTTAGVDTYLNLGNNKVVEVDASNITAPTKLCDSGNSCSADELAAFDLYEWQLAMAGESVQVGADADDDRVGGLVAPTGCISGPGDGSGFVTVTLAWRGKIPVNQPNLADITCGVASGIYDDAAGDAAFRRHVTVRTYIVGLEP